MTPEQKDRTANYIGSAVMIALMALFLVYCVPIIGTKNADTSWDDCQIEWDGRTNPWTCE